MGWFSKKKVDEVDPTDVDAVETSYEEPEDLIYEHHHNAMQRYWESIGSVDSDVLTYVINPMFQGAPPWPTDPRLLLRACLSRPRMHSYANRGDCCTANGCIPHKHMVEC